MRTICPPHWKRINHLHPLARGLMLCFPLNENTGDKVNDLSGNGNHGTLHNFDFPPTIDSGWNPGRTGFALAFDGNDYISVATSDSLDITNAITVVTWARVDSIFSRVLVNRRWNNNDEGWMLHTQNNKFAFAHSDTPGSGNEEAIEFGSIYEAGAWYHVAGTYDGTNHAIYVNAIEKKEEATYGIRNPDEPVIIGATKIPSGNLGYFLQGQIGEVLLYNRALSATEIAWLYQESYAFIR